MLDTLLSVSLSQHYQEQHLPAKIRNSPYQRLMATAFTSKYQKQKNLTGTISRAGRPGGCA